MSSAEMEQRRTGRAGAAFPAAVTAPTLFSSSVGLQEALSKSLLDLTCLAISVSVDRCQSAH